MADIKNASEEPSPTTQEQLAGLVQQATLNLIRQTSRINFWDDSLSVSLSESGLASWLGLSKDHSFQARSLVAAVKRGSKSYRSFAITISEKEENGYRFLKVTAELNDEFEWRDAWEEAWSLSPNPNPQCLTDNALKLYRWLKGPKFDGKEIDENSLGRRANLRGAYYHIPYYLKEIQVKADPCLAFVEAKWRGPLNISFLNEPARYYDIGPFNPPLSLLTTSVTHQELEKFKSWLYEAIQKTEFKTGTEVMGLFDIANRKTLNSCFLDWPEGVGFEYKLRDFFGALKLVPGLEVAHSFEDGLSRWLVVGRVKKECNWKKIREEIEEKLTEISLDQKYGLSPDACALLKWILELRPNEMLNRLTPPVEDHVKVDIGFTTKWSEENLGAYIDLLIEEINERTEFDLRIQPWRHYNQEQTRIRVKKKALELENIVRSVQLFGLSKNRVLTEEDVRKAIESLVS